MILWLFLTFFAVSILFLFYGGSNDDQISLTLGFSFLLLPGFALSGLDAPLIPDTPGIQYPDGFNETTTYTYDINATGQNDDILSTNTIREQQYSTYQNSMFGIILLLAASFGMWFSISNINNKADNEIFPRIKWRFYK